MEATPNLRPGYLQIGSLGGLYLPLNKPGSVLEHIVQLEFASLAHQNGRQIGNVAGAFHGDRLTAQ
jgi:hypothetical protein